MIRSPAPNPAQGLEDSSGSFEEFFHREYARLAKALYVVTHDPEVADDLAQEALVRVYERWEKVRIMRSPVGYLYRVALNLNRSRLRRMAMAARRLVSPRPKPDPLLAVEAREELDRLLGRLTRAQLEAVILVEWLGFGAEEAAGAMRISPGAVRTRLSRAREALREIGEVE